MVFHHPPFLFFHFPHQQKRPVQRRAKLPAFCPQFVHALSSWRHFCSKSNPSFIGMVTTLYSYRGMIHPPNRSSANLHSNSNHPPLRKQENRCAPSCSRELRSLLAAKPPTGRFCWFLLIGSKPGTFSLTKSSPIGKRKFSCRFSLQKALER